MNRSKCALRDGDWLRHYIASATITLTLLTLVLSGFEFPRMIGKTRTNRRWRPQFGLRSLLFSTAVAAFGIWFGLAYSSGCQERKAADWARHQNGHLGYAYLVDPEGKDARDIPLPTPMFLRQLLGREFFTSVRGICLDNKFITDLSPLTKLRDLRILAIYTDILPEADLSVITELKQLEELYIDYTGLTSQQLAEIESLRTAMPRCKIKVGSDVVIYD